VADTGMARASAEQGEMVDILSNEHVVCGFCGSAKCVKAPDWPENCKLVKLLAQPCLPLRWPCKPL
jgi:hypothetical protein